MTDASWPLRALVIALFASSLALFWLRLRRVLLIIHGSKPTADFSLKPLGPRVRQFLSGR